jgi:hypothetical protein
MTNPTSNFGWQMPTSTDLVTDLPADFEVFGQAVDTSLADLKGGTTNQVLAKNSNTDMDFKWVADASGIPASSFTAKGDLLVGTGSGTYSAQGVGANGTVLTADSAEADGVKWVAPSAGVTAWSLLNTGGTALTGATTITVSGISNQKSLLVLIDAASSANANSNMTLRINTDSAANYSNYGMSIQAKDPYDVGILQTASGYSTATSILLGKIGGSLASGSVSGSVFIDQADQTGWKRFSCAAAGTDPSHTGNFGPVGYTTQGFYEGSASITSVSIISSTGNFDAGTIYVLGGV